MATPDRTTQLDLFGEIQTPPQPSTTTMVSGVSVSPARTPKAEKNNSANHGSIKPHRVISAKGRLRAHRKRLKAAGLSRVEATVDAATLRVLKAVALAKNTGSAAKVVGDVLKEWAARQRISED